VAITFAGSWPSGGDDPPPLARASWPASCYWRCWPVIIGTAPP